MEGTDAPDHTHDVYRYMRQSPGEPQAVLLGSQVEYRDLAGGCKAVFEDLKSSGVGADFVRDLAESSLSFAIVQQQSRMRSRHYEIWILSTDLVALWATSIPLA